MAQPSKTSIDPGVIARVAAGVRYAFTGQAPEWFGPMQPLPEVVPAEQRDSVVGRRFDFQVGVNTQTRPRVNEPVTFEQMRALADSWDLLRLVIETRKDQIAKLNWTIKPRDKKAKPDARCDKLIAFFSSPDKSSTWDDWLRMLLEDLFVLDAPALYVRRTLGGEVYALEPVDGATIKRVIDEHGRRPLPPDPAYQQILKGVPAVDYTADELIYKPRNPRTHKLYGMSPVEQTITTINIALRRQANQLSYYTEGNVPDTIFRVPKEWNPNQIKQFQDWWNSECMGQSKKIARFIPEGPDPIDTKPQALKDTFDEWLARVVCYAFSIDPTPFVAQVNRSVAETTRQQSLSEGLAPLQNWVKSLIDGVLVTHFGAADLEFCWADEAAIDPLVRAQIDQIYVQAKVLHPDEVRADMGREPMTAEQKADMAPPAPSLGGFFGDVGAGAVGEAQSSSEAPAPGDKNKQPDASAKEALAKAKKGGTSHIDRDRREVGRQRKALEKTIAGFLADKTQGLVDQLAAKIGTDSATKSAQGGGVREQAARIVDALDLDDWLELADLAEPQLVAMAVSGGSAALKQLGLADDADLEALMRERATTWAKSRAAEMVGMKVVDGDLVPNPNAQWQITDGTRELLRGLTEQALDEGWSTDELASQITDSYAMSDERAETIARTEIARADIAGSVEGWQATGLVAQQEWLTAPECCDECQDMNGELTELGKAFEGGRYVPLHPNCRCAVLPVIDDEQDKGK